MAGKNSILVILIAKLIYNSVEAFNATLSDGNVTSCSIVKEIHEPTAMAFSGICFPYNLKFPSGYCRNILKDTLVHGSDDREIQAREKQLLMYQFTKSFVQKRNASSPTAGSTDIEKMGIGDTWFNVRKSCLEMIDVVYCHFFFPRCDIASGPQPLCRETCEELFDHVCDRELKMVKDFMNSAGGTGYPYTFDLINCTALSWRNESSRCYYPNWVQDEKFMFTLYSKMSGTTVQGFRSFPKTGHIAWSVRSSDGKDKLNFLETYDCYYGNGHGYLGNESFTISGQSCQSWNQSFPYRDHVSAALYSELKEAGNFCRNPGGSANDGPWCYTSSTTTQWEYCCVPECAKQPPDHPPSNFNGYNTSSTSIRVTWGEVPHHYIHGILLGYHVTCRESYSKGKEYFAEFKPDTHHWEISKLYSFVNYSCKVRGYNSFGNGSWSGELTVSTDEDIPCAPPQSIKAWNLSSTSLQFQWDPVPLSCQNGHILDYTLTLTSVRPSREIVGTFHTKDRRINVTGLNKYSEYQISVCAATRLGMGPTKHSIVRTAEDVPDRPPTAVTTLSDQKHAADVYWTPVPLEFSNGIVLGYKVLHSMVHDTYRVNVTRLPADKRSYKIRGLNSNTNYSVQVLAFTARGDGVKSAPSFVKTAGDPILIIAVVSAAVPLSLVVVGVSLVVYLRKRKRASANSASDRESTLGSVTPYAVSAPNWLDEIVNRQLRGYDELENENVPTATTLPRYINVLPNGLLNLPPNMRSMVIEFEQLYENTRYRKLTTRRRSFSGAVDAQGRPMYDTLKRVMSPTSGRERGQKNIAVQETATAELKGNGRDCHSIDPGEVRENVTFFHDDAGEHWAVISDQRRRRFSVDVGEIREFIALRQLRIQNDEGRTTVTTETE